MKYIKTFENFILESKNVGILYHILTYDKLINIFKTNVLHGLYYFGVSLTRNKMMLDYLGSGSTVFFKLEIDGNKLSTKYKITPTAYKSKNKEHFKEYEEYVKGKIINIKSYINKVIIQKDIVEKFRYDYRDEEKQLSAYFTINREYNLPKMVKDIKELCDKNNIPLYVQEGSVIKKDDVYINGLINFELKNVDYIHSIGYRGEIFTPTEDFGGRFGFVKDNILYTTDMKLFDSDFHIGKKYKTIPFSDLESYENCKKTTIKKEIIDGKNSYRLYYLKFEILDNKEYYLKDVRGIY